MVVPGALRAVGRAGRHAPVPGAGYWAARGRRRLLGISLAFQVGVPVAALTLAPAPFGFQMYSGSGWTTVEVEDSHGTRTGLDPAGLVGRLRMDTDWTERLPEFICERDASVVRVHVTRLRSERSYACP